MITSAFSSLEQNIPGFSLMFVLLTLIFSVSLALREEEVWNTSGRLSIAPVAPASLLGGKLLARLIVGTAQLLVLLLFGHVVYGLRLGHSLAHRRCRNCGRRRDDLLHRRGRGLRAYP